MVPHIIPYQPYLEYLLTKALHDEGVKDDEIHINTDPTFIVADESGYAGFVTFRMEHGYPRLVHFLGFKGRRNFDTLRMLFKALIGAVIMTGAVMFIGTVPKDKQYFRRFIKRWVGKDEPYSIDEEGTRQYLIPVIGKGGQIL